MFDSTIWPPIMANSLALWVSQVIKWELAGMTMVGMQGDVNVPDIHCVAYVYAGLVLGWKPG